MPSEGKTAAVMLFTQVSVMAVTEYCLWGLFSLTHSSRQPVRDRLWGVCHCTWVWLFSSVKMPSHRGKWIQSRPSLLVHMGWGEETCWQVAKSHHLLIFLSALCHFANQPSPFQLHLTKQMLAGIWLLVALCQWVEMYLRQMQQYLSWQNISKSPKTLTSTLSRWAVLLRGKSYLWCLWHFLYVGKMCQPSVLSLCGLNTELGLGCINCTYHMVFHWSLMLSMFSFATRSVRNPGQQPHIIWQFLVPLIHFRHNSLYFRQQVNTSLQH